MQYYEMLYGRPEEVLQGIVAHGAVFSREEYSVAITLIARSMRVFDTAALDRALQDLKLLCQQI
jgi:hypothetical protein